MKLEIITAYIVALFSLFSSCNRNSAPKEDEPCIIQTDSIANASTLLTLPFAERIMGEPGNLLAILLSKRSIRSNINVTILQFQKTI